MNPSKSPNSVGVLVFPWWRRVQTGGVAQPGALTLCSNFTACLNQLSSNYRHRPTYSLLEIYTPGIPWRENC